MKMDINTDMFLHLIESYRFILCDNPSDILHIFKYYELKFEDSEDLPDLKLYWFDDNTISLYKNDNMNNIQVKVGSCGINIYNLKMIIENNIPKKNLKILKNS